MKKLIVVLGLLFATAIQAQPQNWRYAGGQYYYQPNHGWTAPVIVGGTIVYGTTRPPNTTYIQPTLPPPTPPIWGTPAGMHWEAILDQNCGCYRNVLVSNY